MDGEVLSFNGESMIELIKVLLVESEYWTPDADTLIDVLAKQCDEEELEDVSPEDLREALVEWMMELSNYIPG